VYKQTLKNAKLKTGNGGQQTELSGTSALERRRSTLDSSTIEEEEEDYQ
jgi:hypothetical protein